jgi:hypothetical protein
MTGNFADNGDFHAILRILYMLQICDVARRLYFPYEGRRAEDFFALKNPTASAGFEPANLGIKGQQCALPIHFMWPSHQSYLKYKIWPQ